MATKVSVDRSQLLDFSDSDKLSFVFGSVNGQLESAFGKLSALHAKNSFSLAIVTGNLFAEEQDEASLTKLLNGEISIACPTYFTVGTTPLPPRVIERIERDEEIAPNLHYLGKRSVTKTSEGVRIVALGGKLDLTMGGQSKEQYLPFHTLDDAKALRGANNADILLTTVWPEGIWKKSSKEIPVDMSTIPATETVAELCAALKPRYHYCMSPGDFCFEREPFFPPETSGDTEKGVQITWFISLAPWANAAKAKSMYAFTLNRETITQAPALSTISPFFQPNSRKRPADDSNGFSRFATDHDRPRKHRRQRSPPPGPDRCFFCLAGSGSSDHMVCSIGESSYLATAKGPLPSSATFKDQGLDFPCHMIITPFNHAPTLSRAEIPDTEELDALYKEMTRYREALQSMVSTTSKQKLGAVTWEISRQRNIHVHWQFMPVPIDLIQKEAGGKSMVEAGFRVLAEDYKLGKFVEKDFELADEVDGDYFRVWIWGEIDDPVDGGRVVGKSLVMPFDESIRFDLQYPRKVMAKLLDLENRLVWQEVQQTEDEEKTDVVAFQRAFKSWDFTM